MSVENFKSNFFFFELFELSTHKKVRKSVTIDFFDTIRNQNNFLIWQQIIKSKQPAKIQINKMLSVCKMRAKLQIILPGQD